MQLMPMSPAALKQARHGLKHKSSLCPDLTSYGACVQLPYRVRNDSELLVAFRQHGSRQWDLLGSGERCPYIWDDSRAAHAIQLHACDASGAAIATSTPEAYKFDRSERCPELKLEPKASRSTLLPQGEHA